MDSHQIQPAEYDEIPELTDEMLDRATLHVAGKLVRRGRPKAATTKRAVNLRLDPDIVDAFRQTGEGWQTRINAVLRAHMPKG